MLVLAGAMLLPFAAHAAASAEVQHFARLFLWIAVILLGARVGALVERWGMPAVLGELLVGVILGNLGLLGWRFFETVETDVVIRFLAELGVVILLFQIGLESDLAEMKRVGPRAALVAVIGVVVPFALGTWLVGPLLLPGLSFNTYLFLGATLTATSVGITGRVFRDMNFLQTKEAQIVLGAAVIDDVLGLIILAVVSAVVLTGAVDAFGVAGIIAKAALFLVGSVLVGRMLAPVVGARLASINPGIGMKFTVALSACLLFAFVAQAMQLAPLIGAFAAGLVLHESQFARYEQPVLHRDLLAAFHDEPASSQSRLQEVLAHHRHRHLEDLMEPLSYFVVPFFFVITGMSVKLELLADPVVLSIAAGVTAAAILGKLVAGLGAGDVNRWLVGWGMVPRGEVGLVFAAAGMALGVVTERDFAVIVVMVLVTTMATPPILGWLIRRRENKA